MSTQEPWEGRQPQEGINRGLVSGWYGFSARRTIGRLYVDSEPDTAVDPFPYEAAMSLYRSAKSVKTPFFFLPTIRHQREGLRER